MKHKILLVMLIATICSLCGCSFGSVNVVKAETASISDTESTSAMIEESKENGAVQEESKNERIARTYTEEEIQQLQLPNEYFDIILDGVSYNVPFAYTELTDNGWKPKYGEATDEIKVDPNTIGMLSMQKDDAIIDIGIANLGENTESAPNLKVTHIDIDERFVGDPLVFSFANGIVLNSSEEDVINTFRKPQNIDDSYDGYKIYCYGGIGSSDSPSIDLYISDEDSQIMKILMEKYE